MKSMLPPLVTIYFMTYFHRAGGGIAPRPPGSATVMFILLHTSFRLESRIYKIYSICRILISVISKMKITKNSIL